MNLNDRVPERVAIQFAQAQHLLVYSYFQFSLVSVATLQASVALEAGLTTRLKDASSEEVRQKTRTFQGLHAKIMAAIERGWMPPLDPAFINAAARIRNEQAHGEYLLDPMNT